MTAPVFISTATAEPSGDTYGGKQLFALVALAIFERTVCFPSRPPDMSIFLEPWFAHIVHYGPIGAFAHPFSNYEPAYLYLLAIGSMAHGLLPAMTIIKIISVLGTVFMTIGLAELIRCAGGDRRGALLALILPSVAINDGLLGQCDALWAGSCIFGLAAMIRGQSLRSMAWCGLAVAFKAQAAFIAPVIIGAMVGRRAPWWHWILPAVVFLATLVPPWLMGWPGMKLLTVYFDQAALDQLSGRLANPWMFGTIFAEHASRHWFALGYVAAGAAALIIAALAARNPRNAKFLIVLAALAGTALPFLLPKMLERYYFLGDVMTLALALSVRDRRAAVAIRAVQIASLLSHFTYMYFFYNPWPALVGAAFAGAGLIAMCSLAAPQFNDLVEYARSLVRKRQAAPA